MNKSFLLNYPQNERISMKLLDFFLTELVYARSTKDHELWVVSPWITESNFDLSTRGNYEDLFPGFTKSSISLSQVLKKFIDFQTTINIVVRPPHLLVPIQNFLRFHNTKKKLVQIEQAFGKLGKLQEQIIPLSSSQKELKTRIENLTSEIEGLCGQLRVVLDIFRGFSKGQSRVISFIQDIYGYEPDRVNIYYNYRLHAKILLGKFGGFYGSANVTHSGFNYNDELFSYVTDEKEIEILRRISNTLAQSENEWWKKKLNRYSLWYEYRRRVGNETLLREIVTSKEFPSDMKEVLDLLGLLT